MFNLEGDELAGRHRVGENWDLYIDGKLKNVYVSEIDVDPMSGGRYRVKHYGRGGRHLTTLTLDGSDLRQL